MPKALTDIRSLARSHAPMAMNVLAGIARQKSAPPSARVAASCAILDRAYGKPEQSHELNSDIQITIRKIFEVEAQPKVIDANPKLISDLQNDVKPK